MVPQVLSLLQVSFTGARRQLVLSLYGMVLAAGQLPGSVLITADLFGAGWQPVFLVNVPTGAIIVVGTAGRLPTTAAGAGALPAVLLTLAAIEAATALAICTVRVLPRLWPGASRSS